MHPKPRIVIPVLLVIIAAAAATWYFTSERANAEPEALMASGTIEATQVHISPELGGKVLAVNAQEGDSVQTGDVLVQLDTALLTAQRAQAEAALKVAEMNASAAQANAEAANSQLSGAEGLQAAAEAAQQAAQANLELLQAGASAEQIQAARAQLAQAEASRLVAQATFSALTAGARPEDIAAARARLDWARQAYFGMVDVISSEQIEEVRSALTRAEDNTTQAEARKTELEQDDQTPENVLHAADEAVADSRQAQEAAALAHNAVQDATRPLYLQIEATRKSWEIAQINQLRAEARRTALLADSAMTQEALDAARTAVTDAQDMVTAAQRAYDALAVSDQAARLTTVWNELQAAQADLNALGRTTGTTTTVEAALNQLDASAALREAAGANLANLEAGTRPELIAAAQAQAEVALAQADSAAAQVEASQAIAAAAQAQAEAAAAQVEAARAALEAMDAQIGKQRLTAPVDGVILSRAIEPGEVATPGATLLVIGQLQDLTITVYVPEDRYGAISLGQAATVTVDSFPGVTFNATVTHIADKAEFTPRNVQTAEGRRTTVFAVKLTIENPDTQLKPGMPADVQF